MAEHPYTRLTWSRTRRKGFLAAFATRSSLWLGPDHLLSVDISGYSEEYKRFYYRDIQAITLQKTRRRVVWNWVLGIPTVLFLVGLIAALAAGPAEYLAPAISLGIGALICGIPLLLNNWSGSTCVCQLRTAVQVEELPSLNRLPRAQRAIDRIRPFIAAAQGELAQEEIPARMQEWARAIPPSAAAPPRLSP
jgi:hypothetical protein